MGAKKVFASDDGQLVLCPEPNPWAVDEWIVLDLELWETLLAVVRFRSVAEAEQLETYGTSAFTDDPANRTPAHLGAFRRIVAQAMRDLNEHPEALENARASLPLENPQVDEEYVRVLGLLLRLVDHGLKSGVFYSAWTE